MTAPCPICANVADNRILHVQEKMNGTLEPFDYLHCAACGHLSLATPVADFSPYYAKGYYSFHVRPVPARRRLFYALRTRTVLGGKNPVGRLLERLKPPFYSAWLRHTGLRLGQTLLDVGCGAGNLIRILHACGLRCAGIDPFLPEPSIATPEGALLERRDLLDETRPFDAILFSHSLEHVPDPRAQLAQAAKLLVPGGCAIVRIPLSDSFAFHHYGADWFQWDAPRHIHLFTRKSLGLLAAEVGLPVERTIEDSTKIQFWASEEYRMGIWQNDPRSFAHDPHQTHFSPDDIRRFEQTAALLNTFHAGDQATFILRKPR